MQVKAITVNAAGMTAPERSVLGTRNQVQQSGGFGPECKVTISKEGRDLSRKQTAKPEEDARSTQNIQQEKKLLRSQEQAERAKEIRDGYRERLNEIEKQITDYNDSYAKFDRNKVLYDAALMDKAVEEQQELKSAMESQKQFQMEEGQRRAREAQQMAMQSAQYQEEIDENNRDLLTLLKTMEEAEKAEDEQENGGAAVDGNNVSASAAGASAGDVIQGSAAQFMASAANREMGVEDLLAAVGESGHWFVDTANSITQSVLQRSADIRASLDDETFSDEQIGEMMQLLEESMKLNYENVRDFRTFGLKVQQDTREAKIENIANDPLKGVQETKNSMMLSAADAALGEARQSGLDKTSQELADEVKELIDERNNVDRIHQDEEEEKEEQPVEEETKEEQARNPEELF